ncbi:hypothetical protein [Aminobacter sp. MSH1]|uniref:hypothetical protein n=1 Tax=Aminobacter sp. MSH1 TaxID=374606 RepID=UPI00131F1599|nr:hypothetical protein [Aminobacter sp. MSH1]
MLLQLPQQIESTRLFATSLHHLLHSNGGLPLRQPSRRYRLTAVDAPEKVVAALMGRSKALAPSLAQKQCWLLKIAFTPPKHL